MHRCLIGLPIFLTACTPPPEVVIRAPQVPAELRTPCEAPAREVAGLADVALLLADQVEALDCANGRIVAIDAILTESEVGTR